MTDSQISIELYRILVETVRSNESRRQQISSIFTTLIAGAFAIFGSLHQLDLLYVAIASIPVSTIWILQILYLKNLASIKFQIIHKTEKEFPYQIFTREWELFQDRNSVSLFGKKYLIKLSVLESIFPKIVLVISTVYVVSRITEKLI